MKTPSHLLRIPPWVGLLFLVALFPGGAAAADRPAGSISGRIQNVVTGQYLNNVKVSEKGTDLVAFTDQSGSYRLAGVPG